MHFGGGQAPHFAGEDEHGRHDLELVHSFTAMGSQFGVEISREGWSGIHVHLPYLESDLTLTFEDHIWVRQIAK